MAGSRQRGWLPLAKHYQPAIVHYRQLSARPRHPLARQLARQYQSGQRLHALTVSLVWMLLVALAAAHSYTRVGVGFVWSLPLWLLLLSICPCALWMTRIATLLSRLSSAGSLDALSMLPPGKRFLHLTVCQLVISADDAAFWLGLLRRVLTGMALLMLLLALCIASSQIDVLHSGDLGALLLDVLLLALCIPLEGTQSAVVACLLGIRFGTAAPGAIEPASAALAAFVLLQALSYALAMAAAILLQAPRPWLVIGLFLLGRELMVALLWRAIMRDA